MRRGAFGIHFCQAVLATVKIKLASNPSAKEGG
jgi:hypothetical protein